jgi:hypothetical protein
MHSVTLSTLGAVAPQVQTPSHKPHTAQAAFGKFSPPQRQALLEIAEKATPLPAGVPKHLATHWPKALTYAAAGLGMAAMGLFLHVGSFIALPLIGIPIGIALHLHGLYVAGDMLLRTAPKALTQVRFPYAHNEPLTLLAQQQCVYPQLLKQHQQVGNLLEHYKQLAPDALAQGAPPKEALVSWLEAHHDTVSRGVELMEHADAGVSKRWPHLLKATKPQGAAFIGGQYPRPSKLDRLAHLFYNFPFPIGGLLDKLFKEGQNGRVHIADVPKLVAEAAYSQLDTNPAWQQAHQYLKAAHSLPNQDLSYPKLGKGFAGDGLRLSLGA